MAPKSLMLIDLPVVAGNRLKKSAGVSCARPAFPNLECAMAGLVIAVTDSVFPSLDLAKAALARLNPTYRMSKGVTADDILAVAKDADANLVTYAKLTRDILNQLTKCKAI